MEPPDRRHGRPYCYAKRTAHRFDKGLEDPAPLICGLHVMPWANLNTFWSLEPLLESVPMEDSEGLPSG